jgi:hypothetical protein
MIDTVVENAYNLINFYAQDVDNFLNILYFK